MEWATLPTNFSEAWMSLRKVMIIVANGIPSEVLEGSGDASRRSRTPIDPRLQGPETGVAGRIRRRLDTCIRNCRCGRDVGETLEAIWRFVDGRFAMLTNLAKGFEDVPPL